MASSGGISPEQKYAELRRAVRAYLRAVDDRSWGMRPDGPFRDKPVNWHKRHDKAKAEDKLRRLVGV